MENSNLVMACKTKFHKKLRNPKHATVSLDSLLGLLSSAYGTEELNSNLLFSKSSVNWQNLSVENYKHAQKNLSGEGNKEKNVKQTETFSVTTSTTNLNPIQNVDSEIDITLVSIKSLETLKQTHRHLNETNKKSTEEPKHDVEDNEDKVKPNSSKSSMINEKLAQCNNGNDKLTVVECQSIVDHQQKAICGFYVDDSDHKIVFDIQFTKTICQNEITPFKVEEPEISINVIDITKQTKTCITVDKSNLISKSKYFANVEDEHGLGNLNVMVKCNLSIFQWILQWLRADIAMCKPNLNVNNLKLVLLVAYHLIIDQLIQECLDYFHNNVKSVLETSWDIEDVLDDDLFFKLTMLFSVAEIHAINDYFESFKSRMYCSLIINLVNPNPCFETSQYSTLATMFQCGHCEKLLHHYMAQSVFCCSEYNELNYLGDLVSLHERSPSWNLSKYIDLMYEELRCWKVVYWRLWGLCHFLKCSECKTLFPLTQSNWCPYHSEGIEYFPINSDTCYPIGTYKCCSEIAFKFNVLKQYGGCKFKSHTPDLSSKTNIKIIEVYNTYKHLICCQPPERVINKKFVRLVKKSQESEFLKKESDSLTFWWKGIRLAPTEKKDYSIVPHSLLNLLRSRPQVKKIEKVFNTIIYRPQMPMGVMPSATTLCTGTTTATVEKNDTSSEMYSNKIKKCKPKLNSSKKSKPSNISPSRNKVKKKKPLFTYKPVDYFWVNSESNKDNQDNQRDFEEIAMRELVKVLSSDSTSCCFSEPAAGSYIRLESKWWQEHCGDGKMASTSKISGTVVNRTFPLSWFRRLTL